MDDTGKTVVTLHATPVVKFDPSQIILNTGGWFTATTRTRMNQASNQFNLGYGVYQNKGAWYVSFKGNTIPFTGHTVVLKRGN